MTIKKLLPRLLVLQFVFTGCLIFALFKSFEFTFMFLKNGGEIGANYTRKKTQEVERKELIESIANAVVNKLKIYE